MIDKETLAVAVLKPMRRAALSGHPGDRGKAEEILHEVFEANLDSQHRGLNHLACGASHRGCLRSTTWKGENTIRSTFVITDARRRCAVSDRSSDWSRSAFARLRSGAIRCARSATRGAEISSGSSSAIRTWCAPAQRAPKRSDAGGSSASGASIIPSITSSSMRHR